MHKYLEIKPFGNTIQVRVHFFLRFVFLISKGLTDILTQWKALILKKKKKKPQFIIDFK